MGNSYCFPPGLPPNELVPSLKEKLSEFKKALPILVALRNSNLKTRHYNQLKSLIGHDISNEKQKITLSVLLEVEVTNERTILRRPKIEVAKLVFFVTYVKQLADAQA